MEAPGDTPPAAPAATESTEAPAPAVPAPAPLVFLHEHRDDMVATLAKAAIVGIYAGTLVSRYSEDRDAPSVAALGGFLGYLLVKSL